MTNRTDIATPVWERADRAGISLEWLAAMTGVSYATVYAYKVGRRRVQERWVERALLVISARDNTPPLRDKVSS